MQSFSHSLQFSLKITTLSRLVEKILNLSNLNIVSFELTIHYMKFKDNSTSSHPSTNNPGFPTIKITQNPKIIKIEPKWFVSPGGYPSPLGSSNRKPKLVHKSRVAWQSGVYRQAVLLQEPNFNPKIMSHLATNQHPSGGS